MDSDAPASVLPTEAACVHNPSGCGTEVSVTFRMASGVWAEPGGTGRESPCAAVPFIACSAEGFTSPCPPWRPAPSREPPAAEPRSRSSSFSAGEAFPGGSSLCPALPTGTRPPVLCACPSPQWSPVSCSLRWAVAAATAPPPCWTPSASAGVPEGKGDGPRGRCTGRGDREPGCRATPLSTRAKWVDTALPSCRMCCTASAPWPPHEGSSCAVGALAKHEEAARAPAGTEEWRGPLCGKEGSGISIHFGTTLLRRNWFSFDLISKAVSVPDDGSSADGTTAWCVDISPLFVCPPVWTLEIRKEGALALPAKEGRGVQRRKILSEKGEDGVRSPQQSCLQHEPSGK